MKDKSQVFVVNNFSYCLATKT